MRIALAHDWLTGMRGGEKVLSLIRRLVGPSDIFTLLHVPGSCDVRIESGPIRTSFLDALPAVRRYYRYLLPLMPAAVRSLDARDYGLVISTSHCVAKAIPRSPRAVHLCYCFTPMRYIWDMGGEYGRAMGAGGLGLRLFGDSLRRFDRRTADNVDHFMTTSRYVAERIERIYGRRADVVNAPIDTDYFRPADDAGEREDYYLVVSALAPYKRVDVAVRAFTQMGRPLRVIGSGQQAAALRSAAGANVTLMGWQSDEVVREHYRRCRALVFPGEEDFGLVPLEASACGAPVIALGRGGATETVLDFDAGHPDGPTGLLYDRPDEEGLIAAVERFESLAGAFDPRRSAAWAARFNPQRFAAEFVESAWPVLQAAGLESEVPFREVS